MNAAVRSDRHTPRYGASHWLLATMLAILAGYVDATGFRMTAGLFVSFMSGNSTMIAVELAQDGPAAVPAALVAAFVAGVIVATIVSHRAGRRRKAAVLAVVTLLLVAAAALRGAGPGIAVALMLVLAMGAENGVFRQRGEVSIGVTYMTGTLVKTGQHLAAALMGGPRWAWLPWLLLWVGLVTGAVVGSLLYPHVWSLWPAAAAAAGLTVAAYHVIPADVDVDAGATRD